MLSSIYIKNFAIIDEIEIDFHENMSVLTGETGAGKSILIDAINVVLGNKKTNKISRNEEVDTEIVCHFNISNKNIFKILEEKDLLDEDNCIFRRKINQKNISKIFINDKPVTSGTAKLIGALIIDIHGQHENQLILSKDEQRNRLDNYIDLNSKRNEIKNILSNISNIKKLLNDIEVDNSAYEDKVSLLEFEVSELEQNSIQSDEYDEMFQEYKRLSNALTLKNKINECKDMIRSENNIDISSFLSNVNKALEDINNIDTTSEELLSININILDQVEFLTKSIERYENTIEINDERLAFLDEKILSLNKLARKYNTHEKDLINILKNKKSKLENLRRNKENIENYNSEINENISSYHIIADEISKARKKESLKLEKKITAELKKLGMNNCEFKISITKDNNLISKHGYDKVMFLIKTNAKSKLLPLNEIASGGELSRLSLVIQLETRSNNDCETMIFDEIDTGIGGATAEVLGNHLSKLSIKTQVLCVTHLAQVAAKSNHHYLVKKDDKTSSTELVYLDNEMKINELARMIGGIELTDKTLQFAKELLS